MSWVVLLILVLACGALLLAERLGVKTTLALDFKGDVKRETRWLAQYGQSVCTPVAAVLMWQLDPHPKALERAIVLAGTVLGVSLVALVLKRLFSRVRPGRENAGTFLGPSWSHANWKESFPSSHSACAVTLSAMLATLYPPAAITFWALALTCAGLRYILDAHWPSDVLGGIALGYAAAWGGILLLERMKWM